MVLSAHAICSSLTLLVTMEAFQNEGTCTQDQTSPRMNTLSDDADDIQRQLDNEASDRAKYGRPKTIWVLHFPPCLPQIRDTEARPQSYVNNLPAWDYEGQKNWSRAYPSCGGRSQSPVNLPTRGLELTRAGRKMQFHNYDKQPQAMTLIRDGQRIVLYGDWAGRTRPLLYGGAAHSRKYLFHSLTLHSPSEHAVGGLLYPLESQLLFISAEYSDMEEALNAAKSNPQAMLGISNIYKYAAHTQPGLLSIITAALQLSSGNQTAPALPLAHFSPPLAEYAAYQGSLPAPPCTEAVLWLVRARALPVTRSSYTRLFSMSREDRVRTHKMKTIQKCVVTPAQTAASEAEQISRLRASQSPIAISLQRCPTWTSLDPLRFRGYWDNEGVGLLLNTGQTAYFTLDTPSRPRLGGGPLIGEYIFEQMHFHWSVDDFTGCEHVLDGHGYAAECHFVHYNSKYESIEAAVGHADGLAVVGFLLEAVDAPNPRFDTLVEAIDGIQRLDTTVQVSAESLAWMERDDLSEGSYVTYKGSLTTPPYTECVTWIIYEQPVQIGTEQLSLLRRLEGLDSKPIERNVRPTQRHPPGHSVIYVKQVKAKL